MDVDRRRNAHARLAAEFLCSSALIAIILFAAPPALAQTTGASSPDDQGIETVLVTAERRGTDLQKTAIPATVLTGEDLRRRGVDTINGLQFVSPSLNIQDYGEGALINIRGIGKSDGGQQVPPGTVIYRDGAPTMLGGILPDEPYYDVAAVEVLRGPQGTFAGHNSTGGAIFIRTIDPTLGSFSGWGEAQVGNYKDYRFRGALNVPLGETLAVRIATNDENRGSFYHVTGPFTGNPGKRHEADWRLSVLWQPTDAFKAILKHDYNYIDHGGMPASPYTGSTDHLFDVALDTPIKGVERLNRTILQLNYQFANDITVRSISSAQFGKVDSQRDVDGTANPLTRQILALRSSEQAYSEEVNLLSPSTGRFTWVLGGSYLHDIVGQGSDNFLSLSPGGTPTFGQALTAAYRASKENWGVFGQGTYNLTDTLQLQVGARYSKTSFLLNTLTRVLFFGTPLLGQNVVNAPQSDSRVTGKVNLSWNVTENHFLYAFVATGHKGGGLNGIGTLLPISPLTPLQPAPPSQWPPAFKPEEVTDYEIGWKANFFGNHLHTQLGAFHNNYRNFQVALYDVTRGVGEVMNVGGTTILEGIEGQAQAQFGDLSFDIGASFLHSSLGTFSAIDSRSPAKGVQNLTGREQPNAPRWTAQVGVQYRFHLNNDDTLTPRFDYGMVGARWGNLFHVQPGDYLRAQNLVNAQLVYERGANWEITAYATNLFDLQYVAAQSVGTLGIAGPPRQFGIRASTRF
ncbi:MAG: hypothetical protein JWM77_2976 [Rhodospirillales bacterium]|nr:hypothetical protein [Rhodospirillales bacterium]